MGYGATFGILGGHGPLGPLLNPPMNYHYAIEQTDFCTHTLNPTKHIAWSLIY